MNVLGMLPNYTYKGVLSRIITPKSTEIKQTRESEKKSHLYLRRERNWFQRMQYKKRYF